MNGRLYRNVLSAGVSKQQPAGKDTMRCMQALLFTR
jgi:hypothetical protein